MTTKRVSAALALVLLACCAAMIMTDMAYAQGGAKDTKSAKTSDKKVASRTGVSGALADGPDKGDGDGPTKVQMGIGLGSIVVMIAVVKWL